MIVDYCWGIHYNKIIDHYQDNYIDMLKHFWEFTLDEVDSQVQNKLHFQHLRMNIIKTTNKITEPMANMKQTFIAWRL